MNPWLALAGWIMGALQRPWVYRTLALLGIGIITYTGGEALIEGLGAEMQTQWNAIPVQFAEILGVMNIDKFMSMIVSAYGIRVAIKHSGSIIKKFGFRS